MSYRVLQRSKNISGPLDRVSRDTRIKVHVVTLLMAFSVFIFSCNTWGSKSGRYEGHSLMGCDILRFGRDKTCTGNRCCPHQSRTLSYAAKATNAVHVCVVHPHGTIKVKWSLYRPGVAQRVCRCIALLFHDRGTRRGEWSAARPCRTLSPGKTRYPFYRRLGGPQGRSGRAKKSRPHRDSIPDRPARRQSLYGLSYPAHTWDHNNV